MQRINYENLSQAPLLSSGVGCPPLLPAERVYSHLVGVFLGGETSGGCQGRSQKQEYAGPGHTDEAQDTETEPQAGPPSGQL